VAQHEQRIEIAGSPQEVTQRLFHALGSLPGASPPLVQGPSISTNLGTSMMSWGERVTAHVQPGPQGCLVTVRSVSAFALVDWGRNKKNVNAVLSRLAPPSQQPRQPY